MILKGLSSKNNSGNSFRFFLKVLNSCLFTEHNIWNFVLFCFSGPPNTSLSKELVRSRLKTLIFVCYHSNALYIFPEATIHTYFKNPGYLIMTVCSITKYIPLHRYLCSARRTTQSRNNKANHLVMTHFQFFLNTIVH